MLKYSNPTLAYIVDHWTVTILLPGLLLVIGVLAWITRRWDEREAQAAPPVEVAEPEEQPAAAVGS
jgi:hypothetical protein